MRRRRVQQVLVGVGLGATTMAVVVLAVQFFTPETPITRRVVDLGAVDEFPRGSVTTFALREDASGPERPWPPRLECQGMDHLTMHLVRLDDGSFRALSAASTHLGQLVQWDPDGEVPGFPKGAGYFVEMCHGESWSIDGTRIYGPAPRDLDRYQVRVEEGRVLVDPRELTEGARTMSPAYRPPPGSGGTSTPVGVPQR